MTSTTPSTTPSTTAQLLADHPDLWARATTGAFLDGIADDTLTDAAFDRWLAQDQLFVHALVRAWGVLLGRAPREDLALLVGGLTAFVEELDWFTDIAAERDVELDDIAATPATSAYNADLIALAGAPYPVAITAMWAVEAAYLQAWEQVAPGPSRFSAYVTHWANDGFASFVTALGTVVDRVLPDGPTDEATEAFRAIATHEAAFWTMTTQPTPPPRQS